MKNRLFIVLLAALFVALLAACAAPAQPAAAPAEPAATEAAPAEAVPTEAAPAEAAAPAEDPFADVQLTGEGGMVDVAKYAKDGPYRIGFSNGFSGNSWRKMMLESLNREAARQGADIAELIVLDAQGDVNKQVADIESLIAQEVDAILVIPNSGSAVAPVLKEATDLGIVTVPFNLPVDGQDYTAYIGTDPARKGANLGTWLAETLGGQGNIVALGGLPGNSYTAAAWGAAEPILKDAGVNVLAFKDAFWEEDRAKVVMSDLIAAYPQIDGIWADGGQVATGALKALQAANRPLVPVTGDDYNGVMRLYDENKESQPNFQFFSISEPTWESALALRAALDILRGNEVAKNQILDPKPITKDNYQDYYRPNLPDAVFADTELPDDVLAQIFGGQ